MVACVHTFVAVIAVGLYMLNEAAVVITFTLQLLLAPLLSSTASVTAMVVPLVFGIIILALVVVMFVSALPVDVQYVSPLAIAFIVPS